MNEKFKNLTTDADTQILFRQEMLFGDKDVVYEKWIWDGITAESVIFLSDDVKALDDAALEQEVKTSSIVNVNSSVTISRQDEFTFVNFNFEY